MMRTSRAREGFTIVELLIVIVVIAILAAITIVSYNGISLRANEAGIKSELSSYAKAIESYRALNGAYPTSIAQADLREVPNTTVDYLAGGSQYCLSFTRGNLRYKITTSNGVATLGSCANGGVVTTIAGQSSQGYTDGNPGTFQYTRGIAVEPSGTLVVADAQNYAVRRVAMNGTISTVAGTGTYGFDNGPVATARFALPIDTVTSSNGDVYVLDNMNSSVRKVSNGIVSTVTSSGDLYQPTGMTIDSADNLYIVDAGNVRIRKMTPAGVITTIAGSGVTGYQDGPGASARFDSPFGIAIDSDNNLYVADMRNNCIRKIAPNGDVSTFAGTNSPGYVNGDKNAARFYFPIDVAVDGTGTVYVADMINNRIRKIAPNGDTTLLAGSGSASHQDGTGAGANFNSPNGIAIDAMGVVYVSDTSNNRIRKIE